MSATTDAIQAIRDQLDIADYATTVTPKQIGHILIALSQLTDLIERVDQRVSDLAHVQNERASD